ncbi:unnamed protein product [Symbiodinium sp. KB8]|nr:unnamed protein product [Symbiodinium sp. KB8]
MACVCALVHLSELVRRKAVLDASPLAPAIDETLAVDTGIPWLRCKHVARKQGVVHAAARRQVNERWLRAVAFVRCRQWQLKQRTSQRALHRHSQHARPTMYKEARCTAGRSRAGNSRARTLANCRNKATVSGPNLPPTSIDGEHNQFSTARDRKLRVYVQAFAFCRLFKRSAGEARRLLAYGVIYGVLRRPSPAHALLRRVGRHGEVYPDGTAAAPPTQLQEAGFALPTWDELADGGRPPPALVERTLGEPLRGWQQAAAACLDASACTSILSDFHPASRALMLSQSGPGSSRAACPNRTSHGPGFQTLELVLPSRVAQTLVAAHANRAMALPVWRCMHSIPWVTVQLVRLPVFSERTGPRWKGPRRESAAKLVHEYWPSTPPWSRRSPVTRAAGAQPHADRVADVLPTAPGEELHAVWPTTQPMMPEYTVTTSVADALRRTSRRQVQPSAPSFSSWLKLVLASHPGRATCPPALLDGQTGCGMQGGRIALACSLLSCHWRERTMRRHGATFVLATLGRCPRADSPPCDSRPALSIVLRGGSACIRLHADCE